LNPRLQVSGFYSNNGQIGQSFIDKSYSYGAVHQNNGNVISITNNKDATRTQTFSYDMLNRIASGSSAASTGALSWGETYSIDAWGNLMIAPITGKTHGGLFQHAGDINNRATGLGYDAAGNLTNYTAPGQYAYDPENRIQSTAGVTYTYDADGNRVEKSGGAVSTLYWYGAPGIIAESDLSGTLKSEYVFFNGKRLARIDLPAGSVHYYLSDHLNSTSMVVNGAGAVEDESDYSPFGTEYVLTSSGLNHFKFTSKERDTESQLDYFSARYYGNALGRFITPDPLGGHYEDPQTLNKYSYVRNNPVTLTDPTGLDIWLKGCGKDSSTCKDNYVGTTDDKGKFTRTHLTGDQTKDATLGAHGITVTQGDKKYEGVWDTNKGENGTVTVAGEGALKGYNANVNGNCGGTCVASGEIKSADPKAGNITKALFGVLDAKGSGFVKNAGTDGMNFFHPGATNFRGHSDGDQKGISSTHIPIDPKKSLPNNEWHVDRTFPYDGAGDWFEHAGCATHTICDPQK
jgi:RHS repeat-associated protein